MTAIPKQLAAGRWAELSFAEQMGHIGSEISRTIGWLKKGNREQSERAFFRALELLDLTIALSRSSPCWHAATPNSGIGLPQPPSRRQRSGITAKPMNTARRQKDVLFQNCLSYILVNVY